MAEAGVDVASVLLTIRERVQDLTHRPRLFDVGTVQRVGDGVATTSGLPRARTDELVSFPTGVRGMVFTLDRFHVDVILLGPDEGIQGGDMVLAAGERLRVPVGPALLGRVVDPLGRSLDGQGPVELSEPRYLEREAPGIVDRAPVEEPLLTGVKVVDALVPIGRGQRELILGDRQIGKTALAVDAILNQRESGVYCVYVAIAQKKSTTLSVINTLRDAGALGYTTVVVSGPDDRPALRYLAPYAGCTMAEFLARDGRDVLVVYDDLTRHADAYRELSLLLRRPPGREAYPGDIFYLHARLLERAYRLHPDLGGGSLTALPIAETQRGNLSAYIPTNLISICDGQIMLDSALFNRGIKPAVDPGRSVSRVGGAAQPSALRAVAGQLRLELSQYEEVARFAQFGSDLDQATRRQIRRGERLRAVLAQPPHRPAPLLAQVVILYAITEGFLDDVGLEEMAAFEQGLVERVGAEHPELQQVNRTGELTPEMRSTLEETIAEFRGVWLERRRER
jgi:F-type H+-transporting ATPase subunit alpha